MTAFLLYIARRGLYLAVFYAFYLLVMRRTTFFRFNRIALLAGSVLCAVLPLLKVRTVSVLAEVGPLTMTSVEEGAVLASPQASFPWTLLICCLYNAGIAAVLVTTLLSAMKIIQMEKTGQKIYKDGFKRKSKKKFL